MVARRSGALREGACDGSPQRGWDDVNCGGEQTSLRNDSFTAEGLVVTCWRRGGTARESQAGDGENLWGAQRHRDQDGREKVQHSRNVSKQT